MILNNPARPYRASFYTLLFQWQRKTALWCLLTSTLVAGLAHLGHLSGIGFPSFPLGVFGGALGIFVSFRTNSAYQRWWEGRKLWGRLINTSRHISSQSIAYLPEEDARRAVHRHVAYVHALRCVLRDQDPQEDQHFCRTLDEAQRAPFKGATNVNHALLLAQLRDFFALRKQGEITEFILSDLDESLRHLLDIQGGCERIKKTPFPPLYGHLASRMTQLYALIFPLCVVAEIGWFTIPATLLICMAFQLINEVGRVLENPFTTHWPALPLSSMSLTIERNIRQALGEEELPAPEPIKELKTIQVLM